MPHATTVSIMPGKKILEIMILNPKPRTGLGEKIMISGDININILQSHIGGELTCGHRCNRHSDVHKGRRSNPWVHPNTQCRAGGHQKSFPHVHPNHPVGQRQCNSWAAPILEPVMAVLLGFLATDATVHIPHTIAPKLPILLSLCINKPKN